MARYPNVRGRKDHRPRGQDRMWDEIAIAQRLYLETGGEDIDFGIRSARNMLETYDRQQESGAAGQGLITHAEANRARAQLANLTRQLAIEWAPHGIRVNLLAPGYFATDFTIDPRVGDIAPDQKAEIERLTPLGRVGRLEELDTAVAFLTSPASSYVTGTILTVDGGWTAW